jgi:hypothetical protein
LDKETNDKYTDDVSRLLLTCQVCSASGRQPYGNFKFVK